MTSTSRKDFTFFQLYLLGINFTVTEKKYWWQKNLKGSETQLS